MVTWQLAIRTSNSYGITNLLLRKFTFTENQIFLQIFIPRKFGAIRYLLSYTATYIIISQYILFMF